MTDNSRLIVALDLKVPDKAMELAREIHREIFAIKINWPLLMVAGVGIIRELSSYGRVICDLKIADIPNTNSLITSNVKENGGWGIITHAFTGSDSLAAVIEAAGEMKVFAVVSMSHPGSDQFINSVSMDLLEMAMKEKISGVIAPGNDLVMLRRIRNAGKGLMILSPGIGVQGGNPADAIRNGSDYVIAGRSIYNSEDPLGEVRRINSAVSSVIHRSS
ncbi:orotidine-5'-phosphate decarboxylase [Oxyplasma meridianum]|uniref:Orotidine 5'-phosphate decarboxylase n=1 Tax=Oxyplasma meridianum TaxID=3073602 RepID=A0AAX4NDE0_9ARCH